MQIDIIIQAFILFMNSNYDFLIQQKIDSFQYYYYYYVKTD